MTKRKSAERQLLHLSNGLKSLTEGKAPEHIRTLVSEEIKRRRDELRQTVDSILEVFTPVEVAIFQCLQKNPNAVTTYDQVAEVIMGFKDERPSQFSMSTYIGHIHRKTPEHLGHIQTMPQQGYMWVPEPHHEEHQMPLAQPQSEKVEMVTTGITS